MFLVWQCIWYGRLVLFHRAILLVITIIFLPSELQNRDYLPTYFPYSTTVKNGNEKLHIFSIGPPSTTERTTVRVSTTEAPTTTGPPSTTEEVTTTVVSTTPESTTKQITTVKSTTGNFSLHWIFKHVYGLLSFATIFYNSSHNSNPISEMKCCWGSWCFLFLWLLADL